jgi:hypothetical protein
VAIHRLRKRFRDHVRAAIADTVPADADIDTELRYLVEVLGEGTASSDRPWPERCSGG